MVKHTIKAHMEVTTKQRTQADVVAEIAAASRAVDQIKCADSHERFAHRVMAAMKVVAKAAQASPVTPPGTKTPPAKHLKEPKAPDDISPDSVEAVDVEDAGVKGPIFPE